MTRRAPIHRVAFLLAGSLAATGCFSPGNRNAGDLAGQVNVAISVSPAAAHIVAGQTQAFKAVATVAGGTMTWTVFPSTAGTIDASGLFTASSATGLATIVATWSSDPRYTATATVNVLAQPKPALLNPSLALAAGRTQTLGTVRNAAILGESTPVRKTASADGALKVRTGFDPPGTP